MTSANSSRIDLEQGDVRSTRDYENIGDVL